jgi:hypothetical protein
MTYDRAARRLADNQHGNTPTGDYTAGDDVLRATYPDPKAATLKVQAGETAILDEKHQLAEQDRRNSGDLEDYTRPKTGKGKK